jgi:microcompartment protein CcmL/EutN
MKKTSALAVLEFADIPAGVWAVDGILKKAPIAFVRAGTITRGRYLVLFGGSTASTDESLREALANCGDAIIDHTFLPDIHPTLFDAVFGKKHRTAGGSLLIIETETAASIVRSVEAALKGTPVELIEVRLSDLGLAGKGMALMSGTLHDINDAAELASAGVRTSAPPRGFSHRIIAAPHDVVERDITATTRFEDAPLLELDGEIA